MNKLRDRLRSSQAPFAVALLVALAAPSFAQRRPEPPPIGRDAPVNISTGVQRIEDAFATLSQAAGVRFTLDPTVLDVMPYGAETQITIELRGVSLMHGVRRVLDGLGLTMQVERDGERITPAPVLLRLGRRAEVEELDLLERLAAAPAKDARDFDLSYRIDPSKDPAGKLKDALKQAEAGSALDALNDATAACGWTWRPAGGHVQVLTRRDAIRAQLGRKIALTCQRTPLDALLVELASRSGVTFRFEPGCLAAIDASGRAVDLVQRDVSVLQTIERICGSTGLRYDITDDGVQFRAPATATSAEAAAGGDVNPPSGATIFRWVRISVPLSDGASVDFFVREDELPQAARDKSRQRLEQVLQKLAEDEPAGAD